MSSKDLAGAEQYFGEAVHALPEVYQHFLIQIIEAGRGRGVKIANLGHYVLIGVGQFDKALFFVAQISHTFH